MLFRTILYFVFWARLLGKLRSPQNFGETQSTPINSI
jgi:hypothetical protein